MCCQFWKPRKQKTSAFKAFFGYGTNLSANFYHKLALWNFFRITPLSGATIRSVILLNCRYYASSLFPTLSFPTPLITSLSLAFPSSLCVQSTAPRQLQIPAGSLLRIKMKTQPRIIARGSARIERICTDFFGFIRANRLDQRNPRSILAITYKCALAKYGKSKGGRLSTILELLLIRML